MNDRIADKVRSYQRHLGFSETAAAILTLAEVIQEGHETDHAKVARAIANMTRDPRDILAARQEEAGT